MKRTSPRARKAPSKKRIERSTKPKRSKRVEDIRKVIIRTVLSYHNYLKDKIDTMTTKELLAYVPPNDREYFNEQLGIKRRY